MRYCIWKYWHAAMLHVIIAMVAIVAFDMYLERCEGELNPLWKVEDPLTFWDFRDKLALQMLEYNPTYCHYPGDKKMRSYTKMTKKERTKKADYIT